MRAKVIVLLTFFLLSSVSSVLAGTQTVLYTFTGGADGGQPYAGLIFDPAGNLYGVSKTGGLYGQGTVFELSPSQGSWTETVLYSFTGGTDGSEPMGALTIDSAGNIYGTTSGVSSCGTFFMLSPSEGGWMFTTLHNFTGGVDGCRPVANLSIYCCGMDGELIFGATSGGGQYNSGIAFAMTAFGAEDLVWPLTGSGGADPRGVNTWGYGTAFKGGKHRLGTIFVLKEVRGKMSAKFSFDGGRYGSYPLGDLLMQEIGGVAIMDGVASSGGHGVGTVYRLTWKGYGSAWVLSLLYSFSGSDGANPGAGVIADSAGNLYGTTTAGGTSGVGTVFELTPGAPKKEWNETVLYNFTGAADGGVPTSGLVFDNAGNLYGTTSSGGVYNQGVVYEVTP